MKNRTMQRAASSARLFAAFISFAYMLLLVPHFRSIEAQSFWSLWFLAAMALALAWLPLIWLHAKSTSKAIHPLFSFGPMVLMVTYFGLLFAVA